MTPTHTTIDSPLGDLTLVARGGTLRGVYFPGHWYPPAPAALGIRSASGFDEPAQQLAEYFAGTRSSFELATATIGDEFQRRVWRLLNEIPYGETTTYGELAHELGDPSLARAVGSAVGRNPLSVIVPCHRVIGKDGSLTGYAGGLERKRLLLDLEAASGVVGTAPSRLF
jgi:methylated-DNA-[protein]-cysteine S-methyltransferase